MATRALHVQSKLVIIKKRDHGLRLSLKSSVLVWGPILKAQILMLLLEILLRLIQLFHKNFEI